MNVYESKNGLSVRAYKGDAMTLLAFDLVESKTVDFTGFSIKVTPPGKNSYFLFNRMTYKPEVLQKNALDIKDIKTSTTEFSPIQKFRWLHTPATNHNINAWIFGVYKYEITPRYLKDNILLPLDKNLTVTIDIDISPYKSGDIQIGFTRGFIESQAYTRHFGLNNKVRPDPSALTFNLDMKSGPLERDKKRDPKLKSYTFKDQHQWLGWQARQRIIDLLEETINDKNSSLDIFAFDLNEPAICSNIITLAREGRVRVILDDSENHTKKASLETKFESEYNKCAKDKNSLTRGHFLSLSHSKIFIQKLNGNPVKVLTGSTNFSTNGLYINANHVIVFNNAKVAILYDNVFGKSFGEAMMKDFKNTVIAKSDYVFDEDQLPQMTLRFSPHPANVAQSFFSTISNKILGAESDVLFAVMKDNSASSILSALNTQVRSDKVFTYGITDVIGDKSEILLYKPDSKRGIRVAGKPGEYILPPPFEAESKIPGISIHHKFVVVDFKGKKPVVYCGSSNLAFSPEQKNGDNLIEIRDEDSVTVFAIEAIRLIDHFHFRNKESKTTMNTKASKTRKPVYLHDSSEKSWIKPYYDKKDLMFLERTLLIK